MVWLWVGVTAAGDRLAGGVGCAAALPAPPPHQQPTPLDHDMGATLAHLPHHDGGGAYQGERRPVLDGPHLYELPLPGECYDADYILVLCICFLCNL